MSADSQSQVITVEERNTYSVQIIHGSLYSPTVCDWWLNQNAWEQTSRLQISLLPELVVLTHYVQARSGFEKPDVACASFPEVLIAAPEERVKLEKANGIKAQRSGSSFCKTLFL